MASKVTKVDDLNPDQEATQEVVFAFGAEAYELDLSDANADKIRKAFGPYIKAARQFQVRDYPKRVANGNGTGYGEYDPMVVRAWLTANGIPHNDRGRVPEDLVQRWHHATQTAPQAPTK